MLHTLPSSEQREPLAAWAERLEVNLEGSTHPLEIGRGAQDVLRGLLLWGRDAVLKTTAPLR